MPIPNISIIDKSPPKTNILSLKAESLFSFLIISVMSERYTIGEAAKKLQVSTRTLRFYEEKDLVRPAYTEENGYRFYEKDQIRQLELILFLKELGFSLKQIKILIQDEHGNQSLELLLKEQYQDNQRKMDEISKKQA